MQLLVKAERIRKRLLDLAKIGADESGGISRLAYSREDLQARELCTSWMQRLNMNVRVDAVGNLIGRYHPSYLEKNMPAVVIGSHLDSVPRGGIFDGAMGVVLGLEVIEIFIEQNVNTRLPIEVIACADEEGAYYAGTIGSRAMFDLLTADDLDSHMPGCKSLRQAMLEFGLIPDDISTAVRDPEELLYYFEVHIEQGPILHTSQIPIGIVTGIAGIDHYMVNFDGMAAHAGTTPVVQRDDALLKAAKFISLFRNYLLENESDLIGNIGDVNVNPGAPNVVPQQVIMSVELRSLSNNKLDEAHKWLNTNLPQLSASIKQIVREDPCMMSEKLVNVLEKTAQEINVDYKLMPSGAGHDAQIFGQFIPAALLFVPSYKGYSHCPQERTDWADIVPGANVLLNAIAKICLEY